MCATRQGKRTVNRDDLSHGCGGDRCSLEKDATGSQQQEGGSCKRTWRWACEVEGVRCREEFVVGIKMEKGPGANFEVAAAINKARPITSLGGRRLPHSTASTPTTARARLLR